MRQDRDPSNDHASNRITAANIAFGCFVAITIIVSLGLFAHYFLS